MTVVSFLQFFAFYILAGFLWRMVQISDRTPDTLRDAMSFIH